MTEYNLEERTAKFGESIIIFCNKLPKNEIEVLLYDILNIKNIRTVQTPRVELRKYINIWHITNLKPRDAAHLYLMRINEIKYIATSDKHFIKNQKALEIKVI